MEKGRKAKRKKNEQNNPWSGLSLWLQDSHKSTIGPSAKRPFLTGTSSHTNLFGAATSEPLSRPSICQASPMMLMRALRQIKFGATCDEFIASRGQCPRYKLGPCG